MTEDDINAMVDEFRTFLESRIDAIKISTTCRCSKELTVGELNAGRCNGCYTPVKINVG
jgi:hypothetical protein